MLHLFFISFLLSLICTPLESYEKPSGITQEVWSKLEPYFLPEYHPIKDELDKIFAEKKPLTNLKSLKKAKFKIKNYRNQKHAIVAKHNRLKGYLIKAFLDNQTNADWSQWVQRIKGARQIQASIDRYGFNHLIKVPQKWIYPLPPLPADSKDKRKKNFLLIVEDMRILNPTRNANRWLLCQHKDLLDALFLVLTKNLLIDSVYIDNIPFCKDGRLAFIDTEHYNSTAKPLKLQRLARYLSPKLQFYWMKKVRRWKKKMAGIQGCNEAST